MNLRTTKTMTFDEALCLSPTSMKILMHIDYTKPKVTKEGDMTIRISHAQFKESYPNKGSFYKSISTLCDYGIIEKVGPSLYKINKDVFY